MAIYHYNPSVAGAVLFTVLFLFTGLLHTWQVFRTKTWYFIPFVLGAFLEAVGYVGRIIGANQTPNWTLAPYVVSTLFLLIAPAFFAASIYMILGRIIILTNGEAYSLIRRSWLTKIFVTLDVLSFFIQAGGGGILASADTPSASNLGKNIIIVGLIVQIVGFGAFFIVAAGFNRGINRAQVDCDHNPRNPIASWRKHIRNLYVACAVIFVRSIFRVIEYVQGRDGYLIDHEIYLYIFDGTLMVVVCILFHFTHPSEIKALLVGGKQTQRVKVWKTEVVLQKVQSTSQMALASYSGSSV